MIDVGRVYAAAQQAYLCCGKVRIVDATDRYLIYGLRQVEGWLEPDSADVIRALSAIQHEAGYKGAVGEIGIHHGKLFILLLLTAGKDERNFAIDVFEQQHLNLDGSGRGDRERFLENVRRWVGPLQNVFIIARSSLEVLPGDILDECGRARLVSIDGGHTKQCTVNDLRLIENIMTDEGIVVIDDYFNYDWPDISIGVSEYLLDPGSRLRPFAISANKLYFASAEKGALYRSELRRLFNPSKTAEMCEVPVDIYQFTPRKPSLAQYLKFAVKESPLGPYLLATKQAMQRAKRQ